MAKCIFCQIRDREIPKEFTYEDKDLMVFPDINPAKPVHILVVPKKHIRDFMEFTDAKLTARMNKKIQEIISDEKLTKKGFRVSTNGGGAQMIDHLHFHITGPIDREMSL